MLVNNRSYLMEYDSAKVGSIGNCRRSREEDAQIHPKEPQEQQNTAPGGHSIYRSNTKSLNKFRSYFHSWSAACPEGFNE